VSTSGGITPVRTHAVWDRRYYANQFLSTIQSSTSALYHYINFSNKFLPNI